MPGLRVTILLPKTRYRLLPNWCSLNPHAYFEIVQQQKGLKIVYSPIHGTGYKLVPDVLKKLGFENVHVVDEQMTPDGNFPTVVYPNPEEAEAMSMALKKAEEMIIIYKFIFKSKNNIFCYSLFP